MRILVVDDDNESRHLLASIFALDNHEVVAARDGVEAVHAFRLSEKPFDCVVTDYQMPRKNGIVLIMEIRAMEPKQAVVLVSSDPPTLGDMTKQLTGEFPMLKKPFLNEALLELVKKTCDQMAISNI